MKLVKLLLLMVVIAFVGSLGARFFLGGSEDTWLCQDGTWVKHGNPINPAPTAGCTNAVAVTPTVTIPTISDEELIKLALMAKHSWKSNEIVVTVSKNDGQYASGGVREVASKVGGAYWYAAKVTGTWKIVADGNGVITCAMLTSYPDYPSTMIPECYEETSGKVVKR